MHKTVGAHISDLEQRRGQLNSQVMEESSVKNRNLLETQLRAVESALKFYREAIETEHRLMQQSSPQQSEKYAKGRLHYAGLQVKK
jgi:hypothetical protein